MKRSVVARVSAGVATLGAIAAAPVLSSPAQAATFVFNQSFSQTPGDNLAVTGGFTGDDLNGDGFISSDDGEFSRYVAAWSGVGDPVRGELSAFVHDSKIFDLPVDEQADFSASVRYELATQRLSWSSRRFSFDPYFLACCQFIELFPGSGSNITGAVSYGFRAQVLIASDPLQIRSAKGFTVLTGYTPEGATQYKVAAIPEPSTLAGLFLVGLAVVFRKPLTRSL